MNRKIAIPVENGVLSAHFGHAKEFALVEIKDGKVIKNDSLVPPPHEPGVLPKWLGEQQATDILAGGMGQKAIQLFLENKINVFVGVAQKPVLALVDDLLNNTLESGANYCDH
jgi:predicted Fe-Mo cluster-binding NifX family protein